MTWGVHTTLVPTWFDPAESIQGTPFMVLSATHDALVKPMPGKSMAPCLAESWTVSPDGLVYEFVLRKGVKFHNGDTLTAEDVKFSFELAEEVKRTPGLSGLNEGATLGFSKIIGSIVPSSFEFYWPAPPYPHDPTRAKQLLAEAGYPSGFDAGDFFCDLQVCPWGEAIVNDLKAVGIRTKLRPLEHAAYFKGVTEKTYRNVLYLFSGSSGNAATWLEAFAIAGGAYVHGSYPDIDGLFREQAAMLDRGKREATLHKIQQMIHERAVFVPIWDFAFLHGVGPRVEEAGLGLLATYGFSGPYEDVKLKGR